MATNLTPWNGLDVEKLKVWVHHILPLVYDDSLSYYEVLAKVGAKMNEVIEGLNANNEQVEKVTGFTIEQVQNLTLAFNNFQQSMLTRQENFETKVLDSQQSFETQLKGDIANWEATTEEKFRQQYEEDSTALNNAYAKFLSDYRKQFGVVQETGSSAENVPSQLAWSNLSYITREYHEGYGGKLYDLLYPGTYGINWGAIPEEMDLPEELKTLPNLSVLLRVEYGYNPSIFRQQTLYCVTDGSTVSSVYVRLCQLGSLPHPWIKLWDVKNQLNVVQTTGPSQSAVPSQLAWSNLSYITREYHENYEGNLYDLLYPGTYGINWGAIPEKMDLPKELKTLPNLSVLLRVEYGYNPSIFRQQTLYCVTDGSTVSSVYVRLCQLGSLPHSWIKLWDVKDTKTQYYNRYIAIGDSITVGASGDVGETSPYNYPDMVAKKYGLILDKSAVSGMGWLVSVADKNGYQTIIDTDFKNYDLCTVAYGTNDYCLADTNLGDVNDDTTDTICGTINLSIQHILESNPLCTVIVITPTPNYYFNEYSDKHANTAGYTLQDMRQKMVEICKKYQIACVDQTTVSPFNEQTINTLLGDKLHPTREAYKKYSSFLCGKIGEYYRPLV